MDGDRNLLFAVLALQMDFVPPEDVVDAMHAWMRAKAKSLGEILHEKGRLTGERRAKVDALVEEHCRARAGGAGDHEPSTVAPAGPPAMRYRVLHKHREGGLGEVYVAHDEEVRREVALKQIKPKYADHPHSRARFLLEAEITGGLEHPGVVPVYGLGSYPDGRPYYAMRFIRGESLREAIARFHAADGDPARDPAERVLAFRELLGRFLNVCNAVAYAHSRGILHRDLKPSNVMLGPYGETLVVDWGLAKALGTDSTAPEGSPGYLRPACGAATTLTQEGYPIGTPAYMAPEQADGRTDDIDVRTDVYLLGGILFEVLTGQAPHPGGARAAGAPPAATVKPAAPAALGLIAGKALAPRREDRHQSAGELAREVQRWLADEPVAAYRAIIDRLAELVRQQADSLDYQEQLARNRVSLGLVLEGLGRHADSEQAFREAITDLKGLVARQPAVTRYRADLATARVHLSRALGARGRTADAADQQRKAVAEYDRLMATNPHEYRTNLASVMLSLAPGADRAPPPPAEPGLETIPPSVASSPPVERAGPSESDTTVVGGPPQGEAAPGPGPGEGRARLTLLRQFSRGGMSRLWLARDNDLNREVAIKEVYREMQASPEVKARLLREAQLTAQLEHPNIVPIYSLGYRADSDLPFLVMRHVAGPTLHEAVRAYHDKAGGGGNRQELKRLLRAFVGVCEGLHYAHSRGVTHRDPKPANIIVGERGEGVLLDWGLARVRQTADLPAPAVSITGEADAESTQEGAIVGTVAYMAPEQAAGATDRVGPWTDIFVLGGSLYTLLTGRPPRQGPGVHDILQQIGTSDPPPPRAINASVPRPLEAICLKAMARVPANRYQSAAALGSDVGAWLSGEPVSAYPESGLRRLVRSVLPRAMRD